MQHLALGKPIELTLNDECPCGGGVCAACLRKMEQQARTAPISKQSFWDWKKGKRGTRARPKSVPGKRVS